MPDLAIRNIHNTPHLNYNLEPHSNEFAITSDSIWNSYSQSIITLPIIIGLLGITCVICFQFFWCCEACCCRKMTRAEGTTRQEILDWMKNKIESRKRVTLMFYILIAMVVISMATYYSAVVDVNDGFNTYYDALDYLDNTFTVLADEGDTLQQEGVYLSYNFGNSTCEAAPYLLDSVTVYQAYVSDYMSYVEPVQDPVSNAHDQGKYFNTWKMVVLWSVAGLIYITLILFFLSHLCRGKVMMHVAIGFSEIVLMFLIVSNTVWYAVLILGADFCMDPTNNAIMISPEDTQEMISFYATCVGTNPLLESLESAYNYTVLLNGTIYELSEPDGLCPNDSYLLASLEDIDAIVASYKVIASEAECPPIKEQWDNVIDDATCDSMFHGVLDLWAGEYWTATALFLLIIAAKIVYDHFDTWFEVEETSPFNTGVNPSSSDKRREKSINLGSNHEHGPGFSHEGSKIHIPSTVNVAYSTTFLFDDDTPLSPKTDDAEPPRFIY